MANSINPGQASPELTSMPMRTLGRTGLQISAFALGTVELGLDYGINAPGHSGRPARDEAPRRSPIQVDRVE